LAFTIFRIYSAISLASWLPNPNQIIKFTFQMQCQAVEDVSKVTRTETYFPLRA